MSGTLDFEIRFRRPNAIGSVAVPVEVRKPDLTVVKTGLSTDKMVLEAGEYLVISRMPAGQEMVNHVNVKENVSNLVILRPEENEESPHESEAAQHYFVSDRQKTIQAPKKKGGTRTNLIFGASQHKTARPAPVKLRSYAGNLFEDDTRELNTDWNYSDHERGFLGFNVDGTNEPKIVQLLQKNCPPINMVLPISNEHPCKVLVTNVADGRYTLDAHLQNAEADMMLRYSTRGFIRATEALGEELTAEKLLQGKFSDPIAAAVGAYALLRFNKIDLLHDWTENLHNSFTWLPDGSVLLGEHLARLGRHKEALDAFLETRQRGIPVFSDGLSYLIDRLNTYLNIGNDDFISRDQKNIATGMMTLLQRISAFTDFREPFTTYTGLNILEPDDEKLKTFPNTEESLDITKLISI